MAKHFARYGLTVRGYLEATIRKPSIWAQSAATVVANIEAVVERFRPDGLTTRDYLQAALKQPQLFYQTPATVVGHVELIIEMWRRGLVTFPGEEGAAAERPLAPLFAFLVERPMYFCLADDNFTLRIRYAELSGRRPAGTSLLTRPRHLVERDLACLLGRDADS